MGSNGYPRGTRGSSAGREYNEKSDRPLNLLETKIIRAELWGWSYLEGQRKKSQVDTANRIQKLIFPCGDCIPSSHTGKPELSHCRRGRMLGTRGVARTALWGFWAICRGGTLFATGYVCPVFFFPRFCVQGPALLGFTLLFMLTLFVSLNLEALQWGKQEVLSPGLCMWRKLFLLKTSNVLLCDYRRACRAPVTWLVDKMAPG